MSPNYVVVAPTLSIFSLKGKLRVNITFAESNTITKSVDIVRGDKPHMRMFDTVLERPKAIVSVFESQRDIPVMLDNTWSNSVDRIAD